MMLRTELFSHSSRRSCLVLMLWIVQLLVLLVKNPVTSFQFTSTSTATSATKSSFLYSSRPFVLLEKIKIPWTARSEGRFLVALWNQGDDSFENDPFLDEILTPNIVKSLTVPQIKQQLRLRGLKVSGRKQELVDRLLGFSSSYSDGTEETEEKLKESVVEPDVLQDVSEEKKSKAREFADMSGKELIDVTPYLDEEDKGKTVKSFGATADGEESSNDETDDSSGTSGPEVWGSEAKVVDDYEGRSPVVDGLSRTVVEYMGSNQTSVKAFVVASRDALKPFLFGGKNRTASNDDPESRLREIQVKREQAARRPVRFEDDEGLNEGDETGLYANVLDRDYSDWGKYTLTGAQLSAQEVQGVLLLSDVFGAFSDDIQALAEKVAFECQPVVVMVPDLFRGKPWKEDPSTPGLNSAGQDYEEWRATHSDLRVSVDIRAAAACLRDQYGVSSVATWGTCYGGGRALEVAAGYLPDGNIHDIDGSIGPPQVDPLVAIAWYPTRYNAEDLFGPNHKGTPLTRNGETNRQQMAVMAVFGGNDVLEGATQDDAAKLKSLLDADERVKDLMVKVFPNQDHGFAHIGLGKRQGGGSDDEFDRFVDDEFGGAGRVGIDSGDAEVASLLSTAFMETYARVFLPTQGPAITDDERASEWSNNLEMKDLDDANTRDIRQEIEDSLDSFVEEPLSGLMMDPTDETQRDKLKEVLRGMESKDASGPYKILDTDDLETVYAKLKAADDSFQIF